MGDPLLKLLLDKDPLAKSREHLYIDDSEGKIHREFVEDVEDVIEENRARYNLDHGRWGEWAHVAQIPASVYWDLDKKGITQDPKAFRRWLDDPDNRYFRTRPGWLSK